MESTLRQGPADRHQGGVLGTRKTISRTNSDVCEHANIHPRLKHKSCLGGVGATAGSTDEGESMGAPLASLPRGLISRLSMLELSRLSAPIPGQHSGTASAGSGSHCHPGFKLRRTRSASSLDSVPLVPTTEHAMFEAALEFFASRSGSPAVRQSGRGTSTVPSSAGSSPVSSHTSSQYPGQPHARMPAVARRPPSTGALSSSVSSSASLSSRHAPDGSPAAAAPLDVPTENSNNRVAGWARGTRFDALLQHELLQPLVQRVPETWRGPLGEAGATAWAAASNPISTARYTSAGVSAWAAATAAAGATSAVTRAYGLAPSAPPRWKRNVLEWLEERPRLAGIGRHLDEWHQTIEKLAADKRATAALASAAGGNGALGGTCQLTAEQGVRQAPPAEAQQQHVSKAHRRRARAQSDGLARVGMAAESADEAAGEARERWAGLAEAREGPAHQGGKRQHPPVQGHSEPLAVYSEPQPPKQPRQESSPGGGAVTPAVGSRPHSPRIEATPPAGADAEMTERSVSTEGEQTGASGQPMQLQHQAQTAQEHELPVQPQQSAQTQLQAQRQPAAAASVPRSEASTPSDCTPLPPPPRAPKPQLVPTAFSWNGECHACYLSGTFNRWAERIPLENGGFTRRTEWAVVLLLPPGEYAYKYIIEQPEGALRWETSRHEPVVLANGNKLMSGTDVSCIGLAGSTGPGGAAGGGPAVNNWTLVLDQAEHDDGPDTDVTTDVGALAALAVVTDEVDDGYSQEVPKELFETVFASAAPPALPRHLHHYASELRLGRPPPRLAGTPAAVAAGAAPPPAATVPAATAGQCRPPEQPPRMPQPEPGCAPSGSAAYGGEHSHATLGHLGWTYTAGGGNPAGGVVGLAIKQRVRNCFVTLELLKPAP